MWLNFPLPFWQAIFFWATILAAISGAFSISAAFVSAIVGYKVTDWILADADVKIADARTEAARANEGAATANKASAAANERAAALEKDAADARLEQERLKAQLAWRMIPKEVGDILMRRLAEKPGSANVQFIAGDPESQALAIQIANLLHEAKWKVGLIGITFPNTVVVGIVLPGTGTDTAALRTAFAAIGISYSIQAISANSVSIGSPIEAATQIIVGSKPPPR